MTILVCQTQRTTHLKKDNFTACILCLNKADERVIERETEIEGVLK